MTALQLVMHGYVMWLIQQWIDRLPASSQQKSVLFQIVEKLRSDVDCLTSQRSTLEDTVTSLTKEKDLLSNSIATMEDKIQNGKKVGGRVVCGGVLLITLSCDIKYATRFSYSVQKLARPIL